MTRIAIPVLALLGTSGFGQVFEVGGHGGISRLTGKDLGTFQVGDVTRLSLKDGWRMGFRMTFNTKKFTGHELGYAYNRTKLALDTPVPEEYGTAIHQGFYNFLLYATPEGSAVRPFAAGGGHFSNYLFPGQSVTQGSGSNKFGVNYGGGIKIRVKTNWAIRFDVRQYMNGKPFDLPGQSGRLTMTEVSAGLSLIL